MKFENKFYSVLCTTVLFSSLTGFTAYAEESESVNNEVISKNEKTAKVEDSETGEIVKVNFESNANGMDISDTLIEDIVSQADGSDNITIYDVITDTTKDTSETYSTKSLENALSPIQSKSVKVSSASGISTFSIMGITIEDDESDYSAQGVIYKYSTAKKFSDRTNGAAKSIISVPRGLKETLSDSVTISNSATATGSLTKGAAASLDASLSNTVSYTYTRTREFSGPPKGYTTRFYYSTKYYDRGNYTVTRTTRATGKKKYFKGTYREPRIKIKL
ncbi:hypothetical protein SRABI96_03666 [Peribacillus sp. Bi96]|uniref:hypothetical protein n=1 Tax=Peribacillus sp. Bi96 TaxID=2884273 RepID=UPI001D69AA7E|nr:hypothetical protein [Peribacillus sp. Bi96]CAH0270058.1 hypothetical protein SRABI96_03666 [Peribacillus sp. Bi96]